MKRRWSTTGTTTAGARLERSGLCVLLVALLFPNRSQRIHAIQNYEKPLQIYQTVATISRSRLAGHRQ